ncbi:hypothetical protein [Polynucleobacter sp. MG-27-Goln-C1]|uniref:hypothetical protein n=1 Tax=Polynucleobacter sp. MG-27-Goln-C1 TaxID=1819726 RepID=UPI001C0D0394|nr:hypothetical protein [Polynucleobacter sp. MG-27-Goln-C1]MBU3613025.1 hypothetical protein [Polynucleobacter sp. MG-27-Goln-C1]
MFLSEKISLRLKRVYVGIAMGLAIWLLYASYLILSNAVNSNTPLPSAEFVLTPITSTQK